MENLQEQLLLFITTPIYIIVIGVEVFIAHISFKKLYSLKGTLYNAYLMLLNLGIDMTFRILYIATLNYFFTHRLFTWSDKGGLYWLTLLLIEDFIFYWLHRFDHAVRLFWAVHVTHHSSDEMNFTVGFRSSVFQPLYRFIYFIPIALLGFNALDIALIYSATQIWGILVHTTLVRNLGILEYIFVTPSHHRVHHASNALYLDRNMGMFLIIWDKLFGTFQAEMPENEYESIRYGLTTPLQKVTPTNILFHEWKQMLNDLSKKGLTVKQRWCYLFGPPGWSHDGSSKTSEELRVSVKR